MMGLLFTYALTFGGAAVALFRPFIGLLVYVCFAILKPDLLWPWSVPQWNYSRVVAIALLIGWALKGFGSWRLGRAGAIIGCLIGYWSYTALSSAWAIDRTVALGGVDLLTKIVLPVVVAVTLIDSVRQLKQLAWVIVVSEGFLAYEFNLSYFSGYNRLWVEGFGSMDNNCNAIALVACFGLAFGLAVETERWWLKGLGFGLAGLMVHAILFSFSRGGMLGLVITGVVTFLLTPKRPKHYLMFLVAAVIAARLAGPAVVARFETTFADGEKRDSSAQSRVELWGACWDMMQKNPQGIGVDQFRVVSYEYGFYRGKLAHTLWLEVGAEVGPIGLGCLVLFYGLCVVRVWPIATGKRAAPDPWLAVLSRMVIASLIGFAVSAQFVSLKYLEHPFYIALLGAGLLKLSSAAAVAEADPEMNTRDHEHAPELAFAAEGGAPLPGSLVPGQYA